MQPIEAVNESVWAMAHHPSGKHITGMGHKNHLGFTVSTPFADGSLDVEFDEHDLLENLGGLGINDDQWTPSGPEGLYEVIHVAEVQS